MKNSKIKSLQKAGLIAALLIFLVSVALPDALAYRRSAGGGEESEFDAGQFVVGTAIGMASSAAGSALSSGIQGGLSSSSTFASGFSKTLSSFGQASAWGGAYASNVASNQISRAFYSAGNYAGWDPRLTMMISTAASSVGGGYVSGGFSGMGTGLASGAVEGGIKYGFADSQGNVNPYIGAASGLAGSFAGGMTGGMMQSKGGFGDSLGMGAGSLIAGIPSEIVQGGITAMTAGANINDRYLIQQAASGLHPAAGYLGREGAKALNLDSSAYNKHPESIQDTNTLQHHSISPIPPAGQDIASINTPSGKIWTLDEEPEYGLSN